MRVFYSAKNYSGGTRSGEMEVRDERELAGLLRSEGFLLTSFEEIGSEKRNLNLSLWDRLFKVPLSQKVILARNLSVMISSGLSLPRAVKNILSQTRNKKLAFILQNILNDLQSGFAFSDSLAKYPAVFNDLFVNMVRAGEMSGGLDEILNLLATHLEKEYKLISKVKGAMIYPAFVIISLMGVAIVMLTYVLPTLLSVFEGMDVALPWTTQVVIVISNFMSQHKILVAVVLVVSSIGARIFSKTKMGEKFISFWTIRIPFIKNITMKVNSARFARTFGALLKSGVSVLESLRITSATLSNYYFRQTVLIGIEQVKKGSNLSQVIYGQPKIFPVLVAQMLEVGEETGKTEAVLLKLAEFYEDEIAQITKNISSVIEPALMVVVGIAVGFFAVSMLQPMYSLMGNIK